MSEHTQNIKKNQHECINAKAYELWEKDGCKQGQDVNNWLTAEKALKSQPKV